MDQLVSPKATDSLETWLSYLERSHFKPIDMGLDRIKKVAAQLDLLKPAPYVITVAGTNGKGSTCKLIETALLKSGLRVGVYASPHLIRYNERVRIQGEAVSDSTLVQTFATIEQQKSQSLTYFEFGTLAALALFRQAQLDVVILEVGLGGRLDATNIVDPDLAVITSIDIDHVEFLGDNREAIGREKAGIFRANIPVVIGEPDCPQSILDYGAQLGCRLLRVNHEWHYQTQAHQWLWQSAKLALHALPLPQIPLANAATALAALSALPFDVEPQIVAQTLAETAMTGRFQRLNAHDFAQFSGELPRASVIIDVGHNPHAARYLAARLQTLKTPSTRLYAVFSALADKDLAGIVEPLAHIVDHWFCAGLGGYRGQPSEQVIAKLHAVLPHASATAAADVAQAAQQAFVHAEADDIILVFGSFHTVADFLIWLNR